MSKPANGALAFTLLRSFFFLFLLFIFFILLFFFFFILFIVIVENIRIANAGISGRVPVIFVVSIVVFIIVVDEAFGQKRILVVVVDGSFRVT